MCFTSITNRGFLSDVAWNWLYGALNVHYLTCQMNNLWKLPGLKTLTMNWEGGYRNTVLFLINRTRFVFLLLPLFPHSLFFHHFYLARPAFLSFSSAVFCNPIFNSAAVEPAGKNWWAFKVCDSAGLRKIRQCTSCHTNTACTWRIAVEGEEEWHLGQMHSMSELNARGRRAEEDCGRREIMPMKKRNKYGHCSQD